jgi:hypothetical protein
MAFSGSVLWADPITITTSSPLPPGIKDNPYSETLVASGGITPYNWTVISGTLPSGLTLGADSGIIAGTPASAGTNNFTVKVTSHDNQNANRNFSLYIAKSKKSPKKSGAKDDFEPLYETMEEDTTPPSAPTLSAPSDGSATNDTTPSFTWNAVTDEDIADYHIEIDTYSAFTSQNKTQLLLHMNGTLSSTTFTDSSASAHTVTATGDAQIVTDTNKFGTGSGLFYGSDGYLSVDDSDDWDWGTGDGTIDFWFKFDTTSGDQLLVSQYEYTGGVYNIFQIEWYKPEDKWGMIWMTNSTVRLQFKVAWASDTDWHHMAIVKDGPEDEDVYCFIDGSYIEPEIITNSEESLSGFTGDLTVGARTGGIYEYRGYIYPTHDHLGHAI